MQKNLAENKEWIRQQAEFTVPFHILQEQLSIHSGDQVLAHLLLERT